MVASTNSQYSLTYNHLENKLNVIKEGEKVGELVAEDFLLLDSPLNALNKLIDSRTNQTIACLKIKEKRLQFATHHPIANGILSIISSIGIPLLVLPWLLGAIPAAVDGSGPYSLGDAYIRSSKKAFNWIRPIFNKGHLQASIDQDKSKLIQMVDKIDLLFDQEYVDQMNGNRLKDIKDYGELGWKKERDCLSRYNDLVRIQTISKGVFGRELVFKL